MLELDSTSTISGGYVAEQQYYQNLTEFHSKRLRIKSAMTRKR
jgi:hypothetical protein